MNIIMKIRFGTNTTTYHLFRPFLFGCILYANSWFQSDLQNLLGGCQKSIAHSRGLNVTRLPPLLTCGFSNEYCLCPVLLNTSNSSEKCITNVQLVASRILPLITYVLNILIVQELFSVSGDYRHVIIYTLWGTSIFIFTGITISIYWSSCSQAYITTIQAIIGTLLLAPLSVYNLVNGIENQNSVSDHYRSDIVRPSERINRQNIFWKELV
jgi:hypothetical protein